MDKIDDNMDQFLRDLLTMKSQRIRVSHMCEHLRIRFYEII